MPNDHDDAKPAITQILRALIDEYGAELNLPAGDNAIARRIAQQAAIAHGTVLGILNGTPQRIATNTGKKLAEFFNRVAIPALQAEWLSSTSLDDFNHKRGAAGFVAVKVPHNYTELLATVEDWLCGVHIAYRYSLDSIDTGDVATEVVQIWRAGATSCSGCRSFRTPAEATSSIYFFEGPVILIGRTALLLALMRPEIQGSRPGARDRAGPRGRRQRHGRLQDGADDEHPAKARFGALHVQYTIDPGEMGYVASAGGVHENRDNHPVLARCD